MLALLQPALLQAGPGYKSGTYFFLFEKAYLWSPIKFLEVCFSYRKMLTKSVRDVDRAAGYACADKISKQKSNSK